MLRVWTLSTTSRFLQPQGPSNVNWINGRWNDLLDVWPSGPFVWNRITSKIQLLQWTIESPDNNEHLLRGADRKQMSKTSQRTVGLSPVFRKSDELLFHLWNEFECGSKSQFEKTSVSGVWIIFLFFKEKKKSLLIWKRDNSGRFQWTKHGLTRRTPPSHILLVNSLDTIWAATCSALLP